MRALEAKGIEFGYKGEEQLLKGVELFAETGEILGIIGPNGSGKTTLLNILAWTIKPDRGTVTALGKPVDEMSARERARTMALVPQEPKVAFPFTVLEIALMGRAPYLGRWELEGKADTLAASEALEKTGLSALKNRRFHELSGGERQRVMIAKALSQSPSILLLDEPTAFLDLKHQVDIYGLVRDLAAEKGMAVVVVSHDVNLSAAYCDRVAVLSRGKIARCGPPPEVLEPGLLQEVYGVKVGTVTHPDRGDTPLIFPISGGGR